ncbi:diguanylate cyclase (GGDEF)-like protein [Salipiger aestuarii]|uniref:diguanylate cyclase n=2 Tax=Salipiger aestuarii TaxID=568098 RepID=A0A327YGW2_9RHOB|nr:GGDEF domain-containing protein [Salipiger aestuarii]RAK19045.1 diguanylate cyclase (GGDEF)-like protein [Salipiger aestuarii]
MIAVGMERFSAVGMLSLAMAVILCAGLIESLLARPDGTTAHMSVPSAVVFAVFAAHLALIDRCGVARSCACVTTALIGGLSCLSLLEMPLAPHLDQIGRLTRALCLHPLGFSGKVSVSLELLGMLGAVALLSRSGFATLSVLAALALMLRIKIAVLETVLTGVMLDADLAIWTILCAWCLEFALVTLLRNETLFSCLFMPGRPGNVMRWMAAAAVLVPLLTGALFVRLAGGGPGELNRIAVLCGVLGWAMLLIALAFGHYLQSIIEQLEETGRRDPLTRLLNRHGLAQELRRSRTRYRGLILCDLDRFKSINDRFGHDQGDRVLRGVADALTAALSQDNALLARWGGEEFLILLTEEREAALRDIAERCRNAISEMPEGGLCGMSGQGASASFGCARLPPGEPGLEQALQAADRSLYAAKVSGRNRVVVSTPNDYRRAPVADPL